MYESSSFSLISVPWLLTVLSNSSPWGKVSSSHPGWDLGDEVLRLQEQGHRAGWKPRGADPAQRAQGREVGVGIGSAGPDLVRPEVWKSLESKAGNVPVG